MRKIFSRKWTQLSQRPRLSPYPNCFSMEAVTSIMKDYFGFCYKAVAMFFKENLMFVYMLDDDYQLVEEKAFKLVKKEPKIFKRLIKKINQISTPFLKFCRRINQENLEKKTNAQLLNYYLTYHRLYKRVYGLYFFILSVERVLMYYLKNYLIDKKIVPTKIDEILNILTTSSRAMFAKEEYLSLLKLAQQIYYRKNWRNIFRGQVEKIEKKLYNHSTIRKMVKKHYQKYFWLFRDYEDPILTERDIIKRLKDLFKKDPQKEFRRINKEGFELKTKIKQIEKKYKTSQLNHRMFEAMRDGIYYKELRKKIVSLSLYYTDNLLIEIGRRTNLSLRQVRQFLVQEVELALLHKKDYQEILAERIKLGAFLVTKGKSVVWQGKEAQKLFSKFVKVPKGVKEIKGITASPGHAKGKVKIVINPEDCAKVQKGDIMVTVQAVPSFSSAIMRASALVADGGTGITSHPATLAREAGIPCLINTKIATQVLKDGDEIEVDANKGIIKILK